MPSFKDRLSSIPATVRMSRRGYVEVPNTPDSSQHEGQVNDKAAQRGVEAETHRMSTAGMLVTILGVCIVLVAVWILATATSKESGVEAEFIAFPLPKLEAARQKVFQPDYRYWNMSSSDSQRAWDVLGRELVVYIPSSDLDRYGLARGLELADGYDAYPLAVSHQLHCLKSLRQHYAALLETGVALIDDVDDHVDHCFDYLRQALMCSADMAMEKAGRVGPDGHRKKVGAWGGVHMCRDWERVEEIVAERQPV